MAKVLNRTLVFLGVFQHLFCYTELFALCNVHVRFMPDMHDNSSSLDKVSKALPNCTPNMARVQQSHRRASLLCIQLMRSLARTGSEGLSVFLRAAANFLAGPYQVEIVLNHVVLEVLDGQGAIAQSFHELVVRVVMPWLSNVFSVEKVFHEIAATLSLSVSNPHILSA